MLISLVNLRRAVRALVRAPGYATIALLTLAIGIGGVTAVYSVVDSVLIRPFGFDHSEQLVVLRESARKLTDLPGPDNYKHFLNWKENAKSLAAVAIFQNHAYSVSSGKQHPEILYGLAVSPDYFSVLSVKPLLGRDFQSLGPAELNSNVVVISWDLWQRYFSGDPGVIGRSLEITGVAHTVVGVLPQGFEFPHMNEMPSVNPHRVAGPYEIFTPLILKSSELHDDGDYNYLAIGRLREGVSVVQAETELDHLQDNFAAAAHLPEGLSILVEPLGTEVTGRVSKRLLLLLVAVLAVLLIGCVNLANLQLTRAVAREQDLAVRAALGAGRKQLIWAVLAESIVLASIGSVLGIVIGFVGVHLIVRLAPNLPRLDQVSLSWSVSLVAICLSFVCMLFAGLLPALRATKISPQLAMQASTTRITGSRHSHFTRNALVVGEVSCTLVLLVMTLLLNRSLSKLLNGDRDFDPTGITLAQVDLYAPQYVDTSTNASAARAAFISHALLNLHQIASVQGVAMTSSLPLGGDSWVAPIFRPDHPVPAGQEPSANMRWVSRDYRAILNIPLMEGRDFTPFDRDHPFNALISLRAAKSLWPDSDPIGKSFSLGDGPPFKVVGLLADARINDLHSATNLIYLPYTQSPPARAYFLIRSTRPFSSLVAPIREAIWSSDPQVAIQLLKPLESQVNESVAPERFGTVLLTAFGSVALLLAAIGIYGVTSYMVALKTPEFGVRMALGCSKPNLIKLILRQAMAPIAVGSAIGLLLSLVTAHVIASILYQTKGADPAVILLALSILACVGLLAALIPAWKACSTDPIKILRAN